MTFKNYLSAYIKGAESGDLRINKVLGFDDFTKALLLINRFENYKYDSNGFQVKIFPGRLIAVFFDKYCEDKKLDLKMKIGSFCKITILRNGVSCIYINEEDIDFFSNSPINISFSVNSETYNITYTLSISKLYEIYFWLQELIEKQILPEDYYLYPMKICTLEDKEVIGYEYLLRKPCKSGSPAEFPEKESNIIQALGPFICKCFDMAVYKKARETIKANKSKHSNGIYASINVFPTTFAYEEALDLFKENNTETVIQFELLEYDIADNYSSQIIDSIYNLATYNNLLFAIDDVGKSENADMNNLAALIEKFKSHLYKLKFKFDGSLTKKICTGDAIFYGNAFKEYKKIIVCEYIDTEEKAKQLNFLGYKYGQGEYFE